MANNFDTLIVVTKRDFTRLQRLYARLINNLPGRILIVGNEDVGISVEELLSTGCIDGERIRWVDENELISFEKVYYIMKEHMFGWLDGKDLPRNVTGWYYQQFLKMQYALICEDDYYMVWDGDTIPCRPISMFKREGSKPFLDMKQEYHEEYFMTIERILPGIRKVISRSFISEHMLFCVEYMKKMLFDIEKNDMLQGDIYWEKIIKAIPPESIMKTAFSEFETYGNYVAVHFPEAYGLREWHSFRLGAEFFDPQTINERDFEWLGKDFDAISFEKNQYVREDHKNLFDNPEFQEKLSARRMLEAVQDLFNGGYIEKWE